MEYYILAGKVDGRYELVFGDYDREVVMDEKQDMECGIGDGYTGLRVVRTKDDQAAIESAIAHLNAKG